MTHALMMLLLLSLSLLLTTQGSAAAAAAAAAVVAAAGHLSALRCSGSHVAIVRASAKKRRHKQKDAPRPGRTIGNGSI